MGVRDLLGKEDVRATTATLSDIAETCLVQVAAGAYEGLAEKFGRPEIGEGCRAGEQCEMIILALGKLGGQEMNYHSDLDVVFLYEAEGHTTGLPEAAHNTTTTNQHFFSELAQRIITTTSRPSAHGRLYEVDARLRPTGRSGPLATSLREFSRYFAEGSGQLWERQALCKARVVYGSPRLARATLSALGKAAFDHAWRATDAEEIRRMRHRLEETAGDGNLKRGPGGIVDIEFVVQLLQLKHGRRCLRLRTPNTLSALAALHDCEHLSGEDFEFFTANYRLLRTIEGRLQLMNSTARNSLPEDPTELAKLAHLLRYRSGQALLADYQNSTRQTRRRFDRIFDAQGQQRGHH